MKVVVAVNKKFFIKYCMTRSRHALLERVRRLGSVRNYRALESADGGQGARHVPQVPALHALRPAAGSRRVVGGVGRGWDPIRSAGVHACFGVTCMAEHYGGKRLELGVARERGLIRGGTPHGPYWVPCNDRPRLCPAPALRGALQGVSLRGEGVEA